MNAQRRDERRAANRSREDVREVDQEPHRRGHVVLVAAVFTLVPMLRVVPIVERPDVVLTDLLSHEVQVFSRWPV